MSDLLRSLKSVFKRARGRFVTAPVPKKHIDLAEYWRDRARRHGKRSVINISHGEDEFDAVTDYQKRLLFPLLKSRLSGSETIALDFGCGPGRFTLGVAELIGGSAIGVDITPELIALAPKSPCVSYQVIGSGSLPFENSCFDVVWSCLVLGGIPDEAVGQSIAEIERVLRPGGIFFYVENTTKAANGSYWFFRDERTYSRLAAFCQPEVLGRYKDLGEQITIFAGKKGA